MRQVSVRDAVGELRNKASGVMDGVGGRCEGESGRNHDDPLSLPAIQQFFLQRASAVPIALARAEGQLVHKIAREPMFLVVGGQPAVGALFQRKRVWLASISPELLSMFREGIHRLIEQPAGNGAL